MAFILKFQIDEPFTSIISDVFVAVKICTTAKWTQNYNANKILPDINIQNPVDWDLQMQNT